MYTEKFIDNAEEWQTGMVKGFWGFCTIEKMNNSNKMTPESSKDLMQVSLPYSWKHWYQGIKSRARHHVTQKVLSWNFLLIYGVRITITTPR